MVGIRLIPASSLLDRDTDLRHKLFRITGDPIVNQRYFAGKAIDLKVVLLYKPFQPSILLQRLKVMSAKRREKVFQLRAPTGFAVTAARRKEGLAPEYLQKIIGHANYATTADVYTHIDAETLVSAVTNTLPTNQK